MCVCVYVCVTCTYLCAHVLVSAGSSVWIRMYAYVDIRVNELWIRMYAYVDIRVNECLCV